MATGRRLFFEEIRSTLMRADGGLTEIAEYLELDPDSPVPKLRFRDDALHDDVPDEFDIDEAIYKRSQEIDEAEYQLSIEEVRLGKRTIVGEGDSWMNLPGLLGWKAIGDSIKSRKNFSIRNIGKWGDTLKEILQEREYMTELAEKQPDYFVFSGGGNDLQDELAASEDAVIKRFDPALSPSQYLTKDGEELLAQVASGYHALLEEVTQEFPSLKVFTQSYDFPRPLVGKGKWLGRHLAARDIPPELMSPILDDIVLKLDAMIGAAAENYPSVTHVRCLGVTKDFLWRDDFHPKNPGFDAVAQAIETAINAS